MPDPFAERERGYLPRHSDRGKVQSITYSIGLTLKKARRGVEGRRGVGERRRVVGDSGRLGRCTIATEDGRAPREKCTRGLLRELLAEPAGAVGGDAVDAVADPLLGDDGVVDGPDVELE